MTPELTALALAGLVQVVQYAAFAIPANVELGTFGCTGRDHAFNHDDGDVGIAEDLLWSLAREGAFVENAAAADSVAGEFAFHGGLNRDRERAAALGADCSGYG